MALKIVIFSKFEMSGGSEFRCIELANGIRKFTNHDPLLVAEKSMPTKLLKHIDNGVGVVQDAFSTPSCFYEANIVIVVNTDAPEFSTFDYWIGKSARHSVSLDIEKLVGKKFFFLYNFLISPSRHLHQLSSKGIDVSILTANTKFFDEITSQDRYEQIRHLPRYTLESPIDPTKIDTFVRKPEDSICFGMHSKGVGNKWNNELPQLITDINKRYFDNKIKFRFMGIKEDLRKRLANLPNVTCLKEDEETVRDFLRQLDVFLFFPDWKREEPWARVIAEAMVSGCPVIALDRGGTGDQVLKHHNGFLCKNYDDYFRHAIYYIEHKEIIPVMSKNSIRVAQSFRTENVIKKLMDI